MSTPWASATIIDTIGPNDTEGANWAARLVRSWGGRNGLGHAGFLSIDIYLRPADDYAIQHLTTLS